MSAVASTRMADQNDKIVPVRMKKKTLKKLTNAEKLEVENKKMEERLRTLRQTIEKEKSERSQKGENAPIWQSGQVGAVQNHAKEHMSKNKNKADRMLKGDKKIRVKFLTPDKPPSKQAVEPTPPARVSTPHNNYQQEGTGGNWAVQQFGQQEDARPLTPRTQREEQPAEYNNLVHAVVPTCGQCEEVAANLNCVECGEKYCEHCFASFHRKGALKTHRTRPLTRQSGNTVVRESTFVSNEPVIQENQEYSSNMASKPSKVVEDSLWGDYNESDSAQSFQAAVSQWRGGETVITTNGGQMKHSQQADGCQTAFTAMPEFSFKENENLSYFDRILLKKCKDLEFDQFDQGTSERDLPSRQYSQHTDSPGELTISQLDFFNEFRNIEAKPKEEETRSSSVMIEEVTYNTGGLEEESNCVVEEDVEETRDQVKEQVPVTPYNTTVTIEELITPAPVEQTTPVLRDAFYTPVTSPSTVGVFSSHNPLVSSKSKQSVTSSLEPQPASPRCVTPPREDRITVQSMSPQSYTEVDELSQRYTDTPISPLKRRMPTNPNIERQHSQAGPTFSSSGPQKHSFYNNRPATADVVILSSQAWKQSFFGFLNAGLPGYTLPQSPTPSTVLEEEPVMLEGPPIWCPGESEATNEQFTPRENSIAFSLTEGMSGSGVKEELNSSTDTMDLQLDTKDEDNFDDEGNPGNTTDKDIVKHDGILRQLQPGDGVLADKGFIMEDLIPEGATINVPAGLWGKKGRYSVEEVKENKKIASSRVHVERAIGYMKRYKIIKRRVYRKLIPYIGQIVFVCAHLTNMLPVKMREFFLSMEKLAEGTTDE